jgi:hypothetical protein
MEKGQVTIETLIIMSASTLLLLMFVIFAWNQMVFSYNSQQKDIAKSALTRVVGEVNHISNLGIGSVKTFEIVLPDAADLDKSFIRGKTIILNVAGEDVIISSLVDMNGVWPEITGKATIRIENQKGLVQIVVGQ